MVTVRGEVSAASVFFLFLSVAESPQFWLHAWISQSILETLCTSLERKVFCGPVHDKDLLFNAVFVLEDSSSELLLPAVSF